MAWNPFPVFKLASPPFKKVFKVPKVLKTLTFSGDGGEDGQQFTAFFMLCFYLFPCQHCCFYDYFKPILRFARFTLTNTNLALKICLTSRTVGLAVVSANRGPRLCNLIPYYSTFRSIWQLRGQINNSHCKLPCSFFKYCPKFFIIHPFFLQL